MSDQWMIEYRVFQDGNMWCATGNGFWDLQESDAGFGETPVAALAELLDAEERALEDVVKA